MLGRRTLLVAPTILEARFLLEALGMGRGVFQEGRGFLFQEGVYEGVGFVVGVTGIGREESKKGLLELLAVLEPMEIVVGFGFAGGLRKNTRAGDLVVADRVFTKGYEYFPTEAVCKDLRSRTSGSVLSKLISVENVVSTPAQKAALHAATGAEAVDLEGVSWGEVCVQKRIPWVVVRAVLDGGDTELPSVYRNWVDLFGRPRWSRILFSGITSPKTLWGAHRLHRVAARKAGRSFAGFLRDWLTSKPKEKGQRGQRPTVDRKVRQLSFLDPV